MRSRLTTALTLIGLVAAGGAQAATFTTVGVYDADPSNTVDTDFGGTLPQFTNTILDAFNNNQGGVVDFESGFSGPFGSGNPLPVPFTVDFGVAQSKTLSISSSADVVVFNNDTAGQVDTISGSNNLLTDGSVVAFTLAFDGITGGLSNEAVTSVGFTILSRDTVAAGGPATSIAQITANFSDGNSQTVQDMIDAPIGTDDTFFQFLAPSGHSITSLSFDNLDTTSVDEFKKRLPIDDFAFITAPVPEPSTAGLLAIGLVGLLRKRRRRVAC